MKSVIEWTKVEEGLPDEDLTVLMSVRYAVGRHNTRYYDEVVPGVLEDGRWRYLDGFQISDRDRVTHWADLPEFVENKVEINE